MTKGIGFKKAYESLPKDIQTKVRGELMQALGTVKMSNFYDYKNGKKDPLLRQARAVEAVFAKYGKKNVWKTHQPQQSN